MWNTDNSKTGGNREMELSSGSFPFRYQLNMMEVDTEAGPNRDRTVLFLGSTRGTVLKFLIMPDRDNPTTTTSVFLEELEGYNPDK